VGRSVVNVEARMNVSRRVRQHQAGTRLRPRPILHSTDPNLIKGVEQRAMNYYKPDLNQRRAVGKRNPNRAQILRAARGFSLPAIGTGGRLMSLFR
jgi:hypothetical protein